MQAPSRRPSANHLRALERGLAGEFASSNPHVDGAIPSNMQGNHSENPRFWLDVRPARMTDLPDLGRIERCYPLLQPLLSMTGYNVSASVVAGRLPRSTAKPVVMVGEMNGDAIAFADFKPAMHDRRWVLQALGASTGVYDPGPVWEDVVAAAIRQAGMMGVKRLYAQATPGSNVYCSLRDAGFAPYASETVYVVDSPYTLGAEAAMREQESSDTWGIHQLYNASVPRDVLYAEALTSHAWDISNSRRPGMPRTFGWILEDGGGVAAYVRITSSGGSHSLEVTFPANSVKQGAALIDAVLRRTRLEKRVSRVYIAVRHYQQEIEPALSRMGFRPGLTHELLVRYTAVPIRAVTVEASPQHVDIGDRVPSQAPSVLTVNPRPGSGE